jgi:2-C-methyl-D-erythritol 4-phosphate cytidylyltransferase
MTTERSNGLGPVWALILAGGAGTRAKTDIPKQFLPLHWEGEPRQIVLDLLLSAYQAHPAIEGIVLVYPAAYADLAADIACDYSKVKEMVEGGATRYQSVRRGAAAIPAPIAFVHDAARPIVPRSTLDACLAKLHAGAVAVATVCHPYATMLLCEDSGPVTGVIERDRVADSQCPIVLYTRDLMDAFATAERTGLEFRDESALMRHVRPDIRLETVEGHRSGFKLTYPGDLEILRVHLAHLPL